MAKLALLLLAVVAVVLWLRFKAGDLKSRAKQRPGPTVARMVICMECSVHLPATEALCDNSGRFFCCEAHRSAAVGKR